MKRTECCDDNFEQDDPRRHRCADPPTAREWAFVIIMLALALGLSFLPH